MKTVTLKFIVRTDFTTKSGITSVYLRVQQNKSQTRIKLPVKVRPENWDVIKERVTNKEFDYLEINNMLDFYDVQAKSYLLDCQIKKQTFSLENLNNVLFGLTNSTDFYEFIKTETDNDQSLSKTTKSNYYARIGKFKRFRNTVQLSEVDYKFITEYKNYAIALGNEEITINRDLAIIKSFLNRAIRKGLIEKHDFDKIKIRNLDGKREFLAIEEVQKLRNLYQNPLINKKYKDILRQFLFTCYTGLRYQDLKNLKFENIKGNMIIIKMHKTKKEVEIPLIEEARKLLPPQINDQCHVFNVSCNQIFNRYLKELMDLAEINKNITHHCARHTFATLAFENNMKLEIISKILGHSSTKITLIYAKILRQHKFEAMAAFNRVFLGE